MNRSDARMIAEELHKFIRHDIPHTKNGKSLIFTKSALRKFMERK